MPSENDNGIDMYIEAFEAQVGSSDKTKENENSKKILFLGLIGELGSLFSECKKTYRDGSENRYQEREKLEAEIGDCLWYITAISIRYDLDLRVDVIGRNIDFSMGSENCSEDTRVQLEEKLKSFSSQLPEEFGEYQDIAWMTAADDYRTNDDKCLQALIRNSSHLMRYISIKGMEEGDETVSRLERLLGNLLWYLSVFCTVKKVDLNVVAKKNHLKTISRWNVDYSTRTKRLDRKDSVEERFPEIMTFELSENSQGRTQIYYSDQRVKIGDPLDDNSHIEDGYRFHDAFHLAFAAILTWSPVLRKMLRSGEGRELNRNKNFHRYKSVKNDIEDGARARIIEEAIAKIIHSHAVDVDPNFLFSRKDVISTELLEQIKSYTTHLEVFHVKLWEWENAIKEACKLFIFLKQNRGGEVTLDLKKREINYKSLEEKNTQRLAS